MKSRYELLREAVAHERADHESLRANQARLRAGHLAKHLTAESKREYDKFVRDIKKWHLLDIGDAYHMLLSDKKYPLKDLYLKAMNKELLSREIRNRKFSECQ